jgi:hypothetical protein
VNICAILAALALLGGLGTGWQMRSWLEGKHEAERLQLAAQDARRRAEHGDAAAVRNEQGQAVQEARERVVTREVQHVVEKPVYRNVCIDADGLRILADDIAAANSTSIAASAVR